MKVVVWHRRVWQAFSDILISLLLDEYVIYGGGPLLKL